MNRMHWYILGFSLFASICLALVILFIFIDTEAGLREGTAQWERADFPLTVCMQSYRSDGVAELAPDDAETVEEAVNRANTRLARHPFARKWAFTEPVGATDATADASPVDCRIHVTVGVPAEPGWMDPGGHFELAHSGGRATRCNIRTSNTGGAGDLTTQVIYHELGHCLGLAHDEQRNESNNVMQPETESTPNGEIPDWFSDSDRALLRDMYAPR